MEKPLTVVVSDETILPEICGANDINLKTLEDLLGVPVAAHWYDWHHNPFDTRMPDYFPPLRGEDAFRAHARLVRRYGAAVIVMAFDECAPYPCDKDYAAAAMNRTHGRGQFGSGRFLQDVARGSCTNG